MPSAPRGRQPVDSPALGFVFSLTVTRDRATDSPDIVHEVNGSGVAGRRLTVANWGFVSPGGAREITGSRDGRFSVPGYRAGYGIQAERRNLT